MGFIEGNKSKQTPTPFDVKAAEVFMKYVQAKRLLLGRPTVAGWANEFRLLRRDRTPAEIKAVLRWYCGNLKAQYLPRAFTARNFRKHFIVIEDAMRRDLNSPLAVTVTDAARAVDVALGEILWPHWPDPAATRQAYLEAVQVSLENYMRWRAQLARLYAKARAVPQPTRDERFAIHVFEALDVELPTPQAFVKDWWAKVAAAGGVWARGGKLINPRKWAWAADHKWQRMFMQHLAREYSGDAVLADKLETEIQCA